MDNLIETNQGADHAIQEDRAEELVQVVLDIIAAYDV
jgi:hypothetical protein